MGQAWHSNVSMTLPGCGGRYQRESYTLSFRMQARFGSLFSFDSRSKVDFFCGLLKQMSLQAEIEGRIYVR